MVNAANKFPTKTFSIPFIDLDAQRRHIGEQMDQAILRAVHEGKYIMGPQVHELEKQLSAFCGAKHSISCSNGTDALALILRAKGVCPGQAVFVPSFTFVATAEIIAWVGATAFFVDVEEDSFNMDPASLEQAIKDATEQGLIPSGVIAVDLFGQPADYAKIEKLADANDMWVMADAAQSFGASRDGKAVGKLGMATSTSFFPAKPLGCYGDGGAVFTDDDELADIIKSLRVHGKGSDKYDNVRIGMNGRLDTVQAAILIEKLKVFPQELIDRQKIAMRYNNALKDVIKVPELMGNVTSAWAQYTLILPSDMDRNVFATQCKEAGVPTAVYYPIPLSQQKAYKYYPTVKGGTLISEKLSQSVISLPMHPYLEEGMQDYIIDVVKKSIS